MDMPTLFLAMMLLFWAGAMWYSHFCTYPLFSSVPPGAFQGLHTRHEKGLPLGVYIPFALMILAIGVAFLFGDKPATSWDLLLAAASGVGGIVTTAIGAAPLHIRMIRSGYDETSNRRLLRWNAARLVFALLGAVAAIALLADDRLPTPPATAQSTAGNLRMVNSITSPGRSNQLSIEVQ